MALPPVPTSRPVAQPVPGASWQAHVHDVNEITAHLNAIWREHGAGRSGGQATADPTSDAPGTAVFARAATLNLIAAARNRTDAERARQTIAALSNIYPSRATILLADPARESSEASGMDVRIELMEQVAARGRPAIVFETVTVDVSTKDERQLASIASPLLVPDLPDFLWWAADTTDSGALFANLIDICDRLIVDSAIALDTANTLQMLRRFSRAPREHASLGDLAWARLSPWRRLTTQFFDTPETLAILNQIDEATLTYGNSPHQWSGFSSALLYAGWLGSRLNWRTPGELLPVRGEPNAWRATLRAGSAGQQREVTLTLRPTARPLAASTLVEVRLAASGGQGANFTVERLDAGEIATTSHSADLPAMVRTVFSPLPHEADLLAEELRGFGHDPIFEAALELAAELAPAGFKGVPPR